jgi:uncharacterized membrane protein YjgN (DUF898 family)
MSIDDAVARPANEPAAHGPPAPETGLTVLAASPAAMAREPAAAIEAPLQFTGAGAEYFRIWVVNAVLTIATIGIYSAWAKVRKTSYFARNTRLLGDAFEFSANPVAILRGRILALALFGFYTLAFDFSRVLGIVATVVGLAVAPLLFASATRFRLQNTRWRALRFSFDASLAEAYKTVFFVVVIWLSSSLVATLGGAEGAVVLLAGVSALLLPWMHHHLKAFQHGHVGFAGQTSQFRPALGKFYLTYIAAFGLLLLVGIVAGGIAIALTTFVAPSGPQAAQYVGIVLGALIVVLAYLGSWPYFAARIQRTVWEQTTLGPIAFRTRIAFRTLLPIAAKNLALLIVTAGLYWPFASIAWARYRIGCMSVLSAVDIETLAAGVDAGPSSRTLGEGAVDFLGIDLGW